MSQSKKGFEATSSLPHVLASEDYGSHQAHAREQKILSGTWHLVATADELCRSGDFVTRQLLGTEIQVRNFDGRLVALSNVCAHRHCLIEHRGSGNSARLRCPYHGWEYGADGRTRKIPAPENFVGMKAGQSQLPSFRIAELGQLLFVCLDPAAPALEQQLGHRAAEIASRFGGGWRKSLQWTKTLPVNWKVPVENSLEAYHIPSVHPTTFGTDPGASRSSHQLDTRGTSFSTPHFATTSRRDALLQRIDRALLRALGMGDLLEYRHEHVFPNLLFSFTGTISLAMCWLPVTSTSSRLIVRQFGPGGETRRSSFLRPLSWAWGQFGALATRQILGEDFALFPNIQRGLASSPHRGVLGICEERIHAFQVDLATRLAELEALPEAHRETLGCERRPQAPATCSAAAISGRNSE